MEIVNLIDEDFCQYKKPSMFIGVGTCDFKCDKECGQQVCQNSPLISAPRIQMDEMEIVERFNSNPITEAIVFGGLEPLYWKDGVKNVSDFHLFSGYIPALNEGTDIVVYTGYYPNEIPYSDFQYWGSMTDAIKGNLIFKFGRFIPNRPHRFDDVLGVELASNNQFAINIMDIKANSARDLWNKMVAIQKEHLAKLLKKEYDSNNLTVNEVIEMVMDDIFKDYPTDHLGTFAEIKSIDEFNAPPFPDEIISRSSCGWATCDIQEAIRRAKEEKTNENK